MKKALNGLIRLAGRSLMLRGLVTLVLLFLIFRTIDFRYISSTFTHLKPSYLALALILGIIANIAGALAWKPLLSALRVKLSLEEFARTYMVGLFFALFTPGGLGSDVIRTYEVKRITGCGMLGFGSILISRILSVLALIILGTVSGIIFLPKLLSTQISLIVLSGCLAGIVLLSIWLKWYRNHGHIRQSEGHGLFDRAIIIFDSLREKPAAIIISLATYVIHHWIVTLAFWAGALSLGLDISMQTVIVLSPLARAAALLPLSINGLGIQESAFIILLSQTGVIPENSIALSILGQLILMLVPLSGGIVFWENKKSYTIKRLG